MYVEYKNMKDQSDYEDGCIQIMATNVRDAFKLGALFQHLVHSNYTVVEGYTSGADNCWIRIPLQFDENQ